MMKIYDFNTEAVASLMLPIGDADNGVIIVVIEDDLIMDINLYGAKVLKIENNLLHTNGAAMFHFLLLYTQKIHLWLQKVTSSIIFSRSQMP